MQRTHLLATLASVTLLLAAAPGSSLAQHEHPQHAMHGAGGAVGQLQLKDGQKWPTDASLRRGWPASVRPSTQITRRSTRASKPTPQYLALAKRIEQQVQSIVANCHLPADADANLHLVIADLSQGLR